MWHLGAGYLSEDFVAITAIIRNMISRNCGIFSTSIPMLTKASHEFHLNIIPPLFAVSHQRRLEGSIIPSEHNEPQKHIIRGHHPYFIVKRHIAPTDTAVTMYKQVNKIRVNSLLISILYNGAGKLSRFGYPSRSLCDWPRVQLGHSCEPGDFGRIEKRNISI